MHLSCAAETLRKSTCSVQKSQSRNSAGWRHLRMKGDRFSSTRRQVWQSTAVPRGGLGFFSIFFPSFLTPSQCIGVKGGGKPVHAPVQLWAPELHILNESLQLKQKKNANHHEQTVQYGLREGDVPLMSSGLTKWSIHHTASIILQYSPSAQLHRIYTKHVQSRVLSVLSKSCLIQTLMRSEPQLLWTGFFTQQSMGASAGINPCMKGRQRCALQTGGAVCVTSSFGSNFSLWTPSPGIFLPRTSLTIYASVFSGDTKWGAVAD